MKPCWLSLFTPASSICFNITSRRIHMPSSYLVSKFQHSHYPFKKWVWYSLLSSHWELFQTAITFQIWWGNLATTSANSLRALRSIRCHRLVHVQVYHVVSNLIVSYNGKDVIPPVPGLGFRDLGHLGRVTVSEKWGKKLSRNSAFSTLVVTISPVLFIMVGVTFSLMFPFWALYWYKLNGTWKTRNSNIVLLMPPHICLPLN